MFESGVNKFNAILAVLGSEQRADLISVQSAYGIGEIQQAYRDAKDCVDFSARCQGNGLSPVTLACLYFILSGV